MADKHVKDGARLHGELYEDLRETVNYDDAGPTTIESYCVNCEEQVLVVLELLFESVLFVEYVGLMSRTCLH